MTQRPDLLDQLLHPTLAIVAAFELGMMLVLLAPDLLQVAGLLLDILQAALTGLEIHTALVQG